MKNNRPFAMKHRPAMPAARGAVSTHVASLLRDGIERHQRGDFAGAATLCRQVLELAPENPDAYNLLGVIADIEQKHDLAIRLFSRAIQIHPRSAGYFNNRGNVYRKLHQYQSALDDYERSLQVESKYINAIYNRGAVFNDIGEFEKALECHTKVLSLAPKLPEAHHGRGYSLAMLGRYDEALACFAQALQLRPDYAEAFFSRGNMLADIGKKEQAFEDFERALAAKPDFLDALCNRAVILNERGDYSGALQSLDQAIALHPKNAMLHNRRGYSLRMLHRFNEALEAFKTAALLDPGQAGLHSDCGNVFFEQRQYAAAVPFYDKAVELNPKLAMAFANRGRALGELGEFRKAMDSFASAMAADPNYPYMDGMLVHMKQFLCEWDDADADRERIEQGIREGRQVGLPFFCLSITSSAELQKRAAQIDVEYGCANERPRIDFPDRSGREKIRVGYFSSDFRNHPVAYLTAELYERHDHERFEIIGFSSGPKTGDEMQLRITKAMDQFIDVQSMPAEEVVRTSRALGVDIAVDLNGLTSGARVAIFAKRAAPVQVNYIGHPGTMGASFIDYMIADETVVPLEYQHFYIEKMVYLPATFQVNDTTRAVAEPKTTRAAEGLPESGFVYCCFNGSYKITPHTFDIWMRILKSVPGSVLWLVTNNEDATRNFRAEAAKRGVAPERIVIGTGIPLDEHLSRQRFADLFLDTLPFNAGATASPALWAGLPLLTCAGEAFASRMGASLLRAIDMPELITNSESAYEELAIELGRNPERMQELKDRLNRNRLQTPLFDIANFTRNLEAAYAEMCARHDAGLKPDHIWVRQESSPAGNTRHIATSSR